MGHVAETGSKWRAGLSTSLIVLKSPTYYVLRSACLLVADVGGDVMRGLYGTLSNEDFRQNAALKLLKHSGSAACSLAAGGLLPVLLGVWTPYFFIISDFVGVTIADQIVALLGR